MNKIVYFCAFLICTHAHATIGNAVDFVNNLMHEYNKKEPKELQKVAFKQESVHPARVLACEFGKGFAKTMAPQAVYLTYRIFKKGFDDPSKIWRMNEYVTLLSIGICVAQGIDVARSSFLSERTLFDVIKCATRFVGSAGAAGLLYTLTCLYGQ